MLIRMLGRGQLSACCCASYLCDRGVDVLGEHLIDYLEKGVQQIMTLDGDNSGTASPRYKSGVQQSFQSAYPKCCCRLLLQLSDNGPELHDLVKGRLA